MTPRKSLHGFLAKADCRIFKDPKKNFWFSHFQFQHYLHKKIPKIYGWSVEYLRNIYYQHILIYQKNVLCNYYHVSISTIPYIQTAFYFCYSHISVKINHNLNDKIHWHKTQPLKINYFHLVAKWRFSIAFKQDFIECE